VGGGKLKTLSQCQFQKIMFGDILCGGEMRVLCLSEEVMG
jgi:hypothetical protein